MTQIFIDYIITIGWAFSGAISYGIMLYFFLLFTKPFVIKYINPNSTNNDNIGTAIIYGSVILGLALVICAIVKV